MITFEEVAQLYGLPWNAYFTQACSDLSQGQIHQMVDKAIALSAIISPKYVRATEHAEMVLSTIRKRGDKNIIVSIALQERIVDFLRWIGLLHLVDDWMGVPKGDESDQLDVAKYKADRIREYAADRFSRIVVIGDRETDIEAGLQVHATTILCSSNTAADTKADHKIRSLLQILDV